MAERVMSGPEIDEAQKVFGSAIDYTKIRIADDTGAQDRPWTGAGWDTFTLHVGPLYNGILWKKEYRALLMHELTHAWQGQHSMLRFSYMIESALSQFFEGLVCHGEFAAAYRYELGKNWGEYNVEQQAHIVQDWYDKGMKTDDPRFPYIRDFVRKGYLE